MAVAGPDTTPFPSPANIKGLQVQMLEDALKLGIHHAAVNVNLTALLDLSDKSAGPAHMAAGKTFHFNEGYLALLDAQIKPLSDQQILVYLILLAYPSKEPARDAVCLHPESRKDFKYSVGAFNTVTPDGRAYLQAVTEMLATRWSGAQPEHGRVWGWIVGNEMNSHYLWYNMGLQTPETVIDAYAAAFRIVHTAVRKTSQNARLYLPLDHHWSVSMHGISKKEAISGKFFLDTFAARIRAGGDIDWHFAGHPYPEDLGNPMVWADKGISFDGATGKVTFKNLEVLTRHLEQPALHWQGKPRRVILSEQGFHTLLTSEGEQLQAAAYAYAWEKCRRLPVVDAFIYHRHVDHAHEGGLRLGLWRNAPNSVSTPHSKKQIYDLFVKAGTPEWKAVAAFALPVAGLNSWDELAPR